MPVEEVNNLPSAPPMPVEEVFDDELRYRYRNLDTGEVGDIRNMT
jgi:hypothetical protein